MQRRAEADRSAIRPPRTWLIVLTYQGREHIGECLSSVGRQEEPPGGVKCLVIDNDSRDGTPELVRDAFPDLEVIRNPRNLGFAAGNNVGIRLAMAAGAEYVALLNMDTQVDPGWLTELVAAADSDPRAALIGARIHTADGRRVEFDGLQFDPVTTAGGYANRPPRPEAANAQRAAYACGAGVLLRLDVLASIGLLDESFFAYHEDVELSLRAQICGYSVLNVPTAVVYHLGGGAGIGSRFRGFMGLRNLTLTLVKLYDASSWNANGWALADLFLDGDSPERLEAFCSALFRFPEALEARRRLRRLSRRSYSEVVALLPRASESGE